MALNFKPLINGSAYDWNNITLTLLNTPVTSITKINYSSKVVVHDNYGWHNQPISRSYGNYTYSGSLELYLDEWRQICNIAPNGDPLQLPPFDISISFGSFQQSNVFSFTDVLHYCSFTENNLTANQGMTGIVITVPIVIAAIERIS